MLRTAANFDRNWGHSLAVVDYGVSLTKQSDAADADINVIVKRFGVTGQLPLVDMPPLNTDFEMNLNFHEAQNMLIAARLSFAALPAEIRAKFNNDPRLFVDFASDSRNIPELVKLGVRVPETPLVNGKPDDKVNGEGGPPA